MALETSQPAARPAVPTSGALLCCCGLALLLCADWAGDLTASFALGGPERFGIGGACSMATFVLCAVFSRKLQAWRDASWWSAAAVLVGALACLGRVLDAFGAIVALGAIPPVMGSMAFAVCEAALILVWFAGLCTEKPRQSLVAVPLAYALTALLYFGLRLLPAIAVSFATAVFPLLSATLYLVYLHRFESASVGAGANATETEVANEAPNPHQSWTFPLRPVVLMAVYGLVFYFSLALSAGPSPYGPAGMLAVSLLACTLATLLPRVSLPLALYKLALPLMVAGLIVLAYLHTGYEAAVLLTNAGNVAFTLFILTSLCNLCYRFGVNAFWMFGIVEAAAKLSGVVGKPLGDLFVTSFPVGSEGAGLVVLSIVLVLVVLSTTFLSDRASETFGMLPVSTDGTPQPQGTMTHYEALVWKCSQAARVYSLTQREQEILELMAQGLTINEMAETTHVSYGTAKTHVNHIYRKMGVHAREEALELVGRRE